MMKLNIMAIGAHPDDCDFLFGGTALKLKAQGHRVLFLSVTNGCSGHQLEPGAGLASRRLGEAEAVSKMTGIEYKILDIPDGSLTAELRYRDMLIREIRLYEPDLIFSHRPYDYHPDHRSTGTLVMDCSYLMRVPNIVPDVPVLKKTPHIFYMYDHFTLPCPFDPDVAVCIDEVMDKKTAMLDCHVSQVYEFLPWMGDYAKEIPQEREDRRQWLKTYIRRGFHPPVSGKYRELLESRYGSGKSGEIKDCEAFQLSEYGAQAEQDELVKFFPL